MRAATRRLLAEAAVRYPCIVVSGRAQPDAKRWLRGDKAAAGRRQPWHRALAGDASREGGSQALGAAPQSSASPPSRESRIENKTFSVAVHYRRSREKKRARAAILAAAAALGPVRVIGGKQVVNILPEKAPHKGIALRAGARSPPLRHRDLRGRRRDGRGRLRPRPAGPAPDRPRWTRSGRPRRRIA